MLSVEVNIAIVRVDVRCAAAGAACPACGTWSSRVHGSYLRFPADVPSAGRSVVLRLKVRRFACPNASCGRRTFVEQMPGLTRRHGQRTERLRSTLAAVGLALAGRAGARLAEVFGVSVSRSTVLRLVDALPEREVPAPRVVGVDEYATRKGRHYGTVLVNIETRFPVDLLPDREASSLAAGADWTVRVWDVARGQAMGRRSPDTQEGIEALAVARLHGRLVLLTGGSDNAIAAWDLRTWSLIGTHPTAHDSARITYSGPAPGSAASVRQWSRRRAARWPRCRRRRSRP